MGTCCQKFSLEEQELNDSVSVRPEVAEKPVCIMRIRAKLYVYGKNGGKWGERGIGDA